MQKIILLAITSLILNTMNAQIGVSYPTAYGQTGTIGDTLKLNPLKKTTTIFVVKDSEEEDIETYQELLDASWTITPIKVIKFSQLKNYIEDPKYSFFTIDAICIRSNASETLHTYLQLWMYDPKSSPTKKKEREKLVFATIFLLPKSQYMNSKTKIDDLYTEDAIFNWQIGIITNNIKVVNDYLMKNTERVSYKDEVDKEELKKLKSDTLYITDLVLIDFDPLTSDDSARKDQYELIKKYKYKCKIVSVSELNDLILSSETPIYYLNFIKSLGTKYVTIQNSITGKIIYGNVTAMSYNFKSKDLERLVKEIDK